MNKMHEQSELNDATLQDVSGGTGTAAIILDPAEIVKYQSECWALHNNEYNAERCAACTALGDMSKSICKDMLAGKS